jgi:tetratricopeptide (TPR) repeat protein
MSIFFAALLFLFVQEDVYRQGKADLDAKRYDEAEAAFNQLTESEPAMASKAYEGLTHVELGRKSYDKALEHGRKAIELNADNADAHYALGLVYGFKKDLNNSAASYEKTIALNPEHAYAHYQLGLVQYQLKRYNQTIIHFEKFIELMPNAPEAPQVKSILKNVRG